MISNEQKEFRRQKRRLAAAGYTIKHTPGVGWWVDGSCGYSVVGYFDQEEDAVQEAVCGILEAEREDWYPAWRTSTRLQVSKGPSAPRKTSSKQAVLKCRHRHTWLLSSGMIEWCYSCGAFRTMAHSGENSVYPTSGWARPSGNDENPWEKWDKARQAYQKRFRGP